ncbi:hypothetical protein COO60DRAFT_1511981 [Scenedesmus sp. NREL 46B-D3]|nr:hypothetical protein COO60DRAFT_1511981 [Scenedesmus sp. NREL 46B-D3]
MCAPACRQLALSAAPSTEYHVHDTACVLSVTAAAPMSGSCGLSRVGVSLWHEPALEWITQLLLAGSSEVQCRHSRAPLCSPWQQAQRASATSDMYGPQWRDPASAALSCRLGGMSLTPRRGGAPQWARTCMRVQLHWQRSFRRLLASQEC